ncbi:hypothetical protein F2Q68_00029891 [Brassica cretica]|uniref:Uncharacterized protein n=2 Tax=Brassica cretica TaxID=69181 RepID=A0A8S9G464_BRACR|nr:hypothetical protein F2Q68_00029891 [Brassica cretica]KAF3530788.1 hypothetical protein DY000_02038000 [Brassica cretica]
METVGESTIPSLRDKSDDEEEMERHAFRVEEDVAAFINEPPIRHNIYPDTETDSDTDEEKDGVEAHYALWTLWLHKLNHLKPLPVKVNPLKLDVIYR